MRAFVPAAATLFAAACTNSGPGPLDMAVDAATHDLDTARDGGTDLNLRDAGRDAGMDAGVCLFDARVGTDTCDPTRASNDPAMFGLDGCPPCAKCVDFGPSASGSGYMTACQLRCTPTDADNDVCTDPAQCAFDSHTCTYGECDGDDDCRRYIEDTNGDGRCDTSSGDLEQLDPAGGTCDTATYRCHRGGTPGAHAGDHCTLDSQCERDGRCLDECRYADFTGGYCTKNWCNVTGHECVTGEKCFEGGTDFWLCLRSCTVDAEDASLVLGAGGHGDTCDPGYFCSYDGASPPGTPGNGGCLPGNYNAITTNDVGRACSAEYECYSPHGAGTCIFGYPSSACSLLGCAGYPTSDDVCGTGNSCFAMFGDGTSVCVHDCTTPDDCAAAGAPRDHACVQLTAADTQRHCWPACMMDADCQSGLHCAGATTTRTGDCM